MNAKESDKENNTKNLDKRMNSIRILNNTLDSKEQTVNRYMLSIQQTLNVIFKKQYLVLR